MPENDLALTAIRTALHDAGHNQAEIQVARRHQGAEEVLVEFNPMSSANWESGPEQHAVYAKALEEAGWTAIDLGNVVLLPGIPFGAVPETFTSTWSMPSIDARTGDEAVKEAREVQIDPSITESLWRVTDHVGRHALVHCMDPDLS